MLTSHAFVRGILIRAVSVIMLLSLVACQVLETPEVSTPVPATEEPEIQQQGYAEITFEVHLPEPLAEGQNLYIEILDEVTGLALNPARAQMQTQDRQYFGIKIPIPVGSVVKYRYFRDNDPIGVEYTTENQPVRYRLYYAEASGIVYDTVAAWRSSPALVVTGRIQGQAANSANNAPVVNALVTGGGFHTLTSSDGSFVLEGLPPGTHNLVIYSLDGAFLPFQQGAVVASDSTTPALVKLTPSRMVNVTFIVDPPDDTPEDAPVRLIGSTYQLGNTFADLSGGMSVLASRAPLMQILDDGRYSITLQLPSDQDIRYKYTLGDGFWNAERGAAGEVVLRQLIVPKKDTIVEESIASWNTPGHAPIEFTVTVPTNTPTSDHISIQFNPFGWTQPLPMWFVGDNQWRYVLYSPLDLFDNAAYRYCRNDQCGAADAEGSRGSNAQGTLFQPGENEQRFDDTVEAWAWSGQAAQPVVVSANQIIARGDTFQAGVEFPAQYHPSWQPYLPQTFQSLSNIGANSVMMAPTWHVTHQNPPVMAPAAGRDALWLDLSQMIRQAKQGGLKVVLHPELKYDGAPGEWWQSAERSAGWWQTWFARYQTFALYYADLASQAGAEALVLGDETILPALPGGTLANGQPSSLPDDAELRWSLLISEVRSRFSGRLIWMLPYNGSLPPIPEFLNQVDMIYIRMSPPFVQTDAGAAGLEAAVAAALDGDLLRLQEQTNHPILLGLQTPSVQGALDGCIGEAGSCEPIEAYRAAAYESPNGAAQALDEQAQAYSAVLASINQRSWISGFFASGFYPPVELQDLSVSVRGKPAYDVLWYWYPQLLGNKNP